MNNEKFIVCHNRDRDNYQIALALAESDSLHSLITDYYLGAISGPVGRYLDRRLNHRQASGLCKEKIIPSLYSIALQYMIGKSPAQLDLMGRSDSHLGKKVLLEARKNEQASLFVYSTNAFESFVSEENRNRRKILFLYHPLPKYIQSIMLQDVLSPGKLMPSSIMESIKPSQIDRVNTEAFCADEIVCASSMSFESVKYEGITNKPIHIVPYGMDELMLPNSTPSLREQNKTIKYLFVGQAIQRKGIHHLLEAWSKAKLPNSQLTIVASSNPDGLLDRVSDTVKVKSHLTKSELINEFSSCHCFVLPALLEGFGLVLLEAAKLGCYTIYSDATGFADLDIPDFMGEKVQKNNIEALKDALTRFAEKYRSGDVDFTNIREQSRMFSNKSFRNRINEIVSLESEEKL
jgi:glycosyltransferase involved in cell wall biosynthesis